ncbi:MAG TPA: DUF72 domain-containing protein [Steroidobacteraceae bacterium]|nr:DUF72 domain-containing protein [Steroidobacteraceae bacterium]
MKGIVRVGTAGWSLPKRDQAVFPLGGSHLQRYAARFAIAEVDTSFYRHHRRQTYARWAAETPDWFSFAVKLPRTLTHEGALACDNCEEIDRFVNEIAGLGSRLKVVLVQLPPSLAFEQSSVRAFFEVLTQRVAAETALVCEPRHESWHSADADSLLIEFKIARVAVDPPRWQADAQPGGSRVISYFRWHGSPRIYYSNYSDEDIARFHALADLAASESEEVWCIFDNTALGHATSDALKLVNNVAGDGPDLAPS